MKIWQIVALIIGAIILNGLIVISIYLLVEDDTGEYHRDYSISIDLVDGGNKTIGDYTVLIPLMINTETGEPIILSLDQIDLVLGRCEMEILIEEGEPYLKLTSDTAVKIMHHFSESGENLSPKELEVSLSSQTGYLGRDSASVEIESDTANLKVKLFLIQNFISPSGSHDLDIVVCEAILNKGGS